MTGYTMTYREATQHGACREGLGDVEHMVGGWEEYGLDTPVSLVDVMDRVDYAYALWALSEIDYPAWCGVYCDLDRMSVDSDVSWGNQTRALAHLRMVLGGRIQPGQWRASEGWRS